MFNCCKDCVHYKVCSDWSVSPIDNIVKNCKHFKNKADVEEVKHGEWKEHYAYGCWHYDCPFCDDGYATKEKDKTPPNYCQNCGAKMDGGKVE